MGFLGAVGRRIKSKGKVQAIVSTIFNAFASPCLRIKVTVSVEPVDGVHVMLKGAPAVTLAPVVVKSVKSSESAFA
jgi:hypothetical protein